MAEQFYLKVEDSPFDEEYLKDQNIPTYFFNDEEYLKIDVCDHVGDFSKMFIVDVELTEAKENEGAGDFNGMGTTAKKDYYPAETELMIKESDLK